MLGAVMLVVTAVVKETAAMKRVSLKRKTKGKSIGMIIMIGMRCESTPSKDALFQLQEGDKLPYFTDYKSNLIISRTPTLREIISIYSHK